MFRALLCPSSGARDYDVDYHIGRIVLGLLYVGGKVQLGWSSVRVAGPINIKFKINLGVLAFVHTLAHWIEEPTRGLNCVLTIVMYS